MAYKRKQDEQMMIDDSHEDSQNSASMSVSALSRKDLKGIVGNENSTNFESSLGGQ